MIKIDKQDAKWLGKVARKNSDNEWKQYVNVCDSKWGHVAVACDGWRLHVLGVDASIPNGFYKPLATGELRPEVQFCSWPQWEQIVPPDNHFAYPCDTLDKCEALTIGKKECYTFGKLIVEATLLNDAVGKGKAYRIDAQDKPTKPVKVTFLGNITQFAIVMPCKPID